MIISINPYKKLPIYESNFIKRYQTSPKEDLPPHLFAMAQTAFDNIVRLNESQSVVISGESGAGKTEATKVVLRFLTAVAGSNETTKGKNINFIFCQLQ